MRLTLGLFVGSPFWPKKEQDLIDVSSPMRSRDRRLFFSHRQLTKTVRGIIDSISEEERCPLIRPSLCPPTSPLLLCIEGGRLGRNNNTNAQIVIAYIE